MKEMKIYAICCEKEEAVKILEKIGVTSHKKLSIIKNREQE